MTPPTLSMLDQKTRARFEIRFQAALENLYGDLHTYIVKELQTTVGLPVTFWKYQQEILARRLTPFFEEGLLLGVEAERSRFLEQSIAINVGAQVRETAAQLARDLAQETTTTIAGRVRNILDESNSLDMLHRRLQAAFSSSYTDMIAATETTRMISAGQLLVWRAHRPPMKTAPKLTPPGAPAYVVGKRWQVDSDSSVCPICAPLDGHIVYLDDAFNVPGSKAMLDAPPAHPRCRCYLEPIWSDERLHTEQADTDDPCVDERGYNARRACYIDELAEYGLTVRRDEFNPEQLNHILNAAQITGARLTECLDELSPQEAFQAVFGPVEFWYDPSTTNTQGTTDTETFSDKAIIILPQGAFDEYEGNEILDVEFVVIHEFGHVFQNYLGQVPKNQTESFEITVREGGTEYDHEMTLPGRTPYIIVDYLEATGIRLDVILVRNGVVSRRTTNT